jgi:arylsulfatase A-like enzyme
VPLNRRQFLIGATSAAAFAAKKPVERPNILFILADDLAAWMLGCYGNKEIKTPNIDNLARGGMRFANNFCCTPICSPSRATLFTGRVPRQHGIYDFLTPKPIENPPQGQEAPPSSFAQEIMISDVLGKQGYNCGYVGKWHMGDDEHPKHGFQYTSTMPGGSGPYRDPQLSTNGKLAKEEGYSTDLMTQHACSFLDQQKADKPFFLTIGYQNPHTPYEGHPQKDYDMYSKTIFDTFGWERAAPNALREKEMLKDIVGNIRKCAASTTALDDQIPVLLRKLQERGLRDNTLIIFAGDNGYLLGRHGLWSKGLASDPINMYEEVMRVPMIWNWPGKLPTEYVVPDLVSFYDVMPTLCEITDSPLPEGRKLCGRSYAPIAMREKLPKKQPWKQMVFGHFRNTEMVRDTRYKLVLRNDGKGPNELFDISNDPRETTNQYDNAQFITVRDALDRELAAWRQRTS